MKPKEDDRRRDGNEKEGVGMGGASWPDSGLAEREKQNVNA